jgi:hypothetical protein
MITLLENDKRRSPFELYLPDASVIALGGNPSDYPELEGSPGVRVVRFETEGDVPKRG